MGHLVSQSREIVFISECVYGGFSPFVKNTIDRSVPSLLPFFATREDGMMHHRTRTENRPVFRALFYGDAIQDDERMNAAKIVAANAINYHARSHSVSFFKSYDEITAGDLEADGNREYSIPTVRVQAHGIESSGKKAGPMKIALINGSPKKGKNNSAYFAEELEKKLPPDTTCVPVRINTPGITREQLDVLAGSDALVFFFPLYADAFPSHLLSALITAEEYFNSLPPNRPRPRVYAAVNNGFYEGIQNILVLDMLRFWCAKTGLPWGSGIGIGTGEMLGDLPSVPAGYGPKKTMGKLLDGLAASIIDGKDTANNFGAADFPRFAFTFMANLGWKQQARQNKLRTRDIYKKPSPEKM